MQNNQEMTATNGLHATVKQATAYREFALILVILAAGTIMSVLSPYFFTSQNFLAMLMGLTVDGLIAISMVLLMISGGFDLSVGSIMVFTGVVAGLIAKSGVSAPLTIAAALMVAALIGMVNGLLIAKAGINPFITTLGMMLAVRGLTLILSDGMAIINLPADFKHIGQGTLGGVQYPIIVMMSLVIIGDILVRRNRFFRQSYYVGGNENAARLNGLNVSQIKIINYIITAAFAGLAGILLAGRFGSASITIGDNTALNVITACIIGGASLNGGVGTVLGAFLGAFFMQMISTSLNLLNVNAYWQIFVTGAILIIAVLIDALNEKGRRGPRAL